MQLDSWDYNVTHEFGTQWPSDPVALAAKGGSSALDCPNDPERIPSLGAHRAWSFRAISTLLGISVAPFVSFASVAVGFCQQHDPNMESSVLACLRQSEIHSF